MNERAQPPSAETPTEEEIRTRAYELSERDGSSSADENWARAERELRGEQRNEPGT